MEYHRRSIRLRAYDYRQTGAYFLTICTQQRACLFGEVLDGAMTLSEIGRVVEDAWWQTVTIRPNVEFDAFVIMPNHLHGIAVIMQEISTMQEQPALQFQSPSQTIGALVRGFKATVTRQTGMPIWQRNFYEHVIRNERDLDRIRQYIENNPVSWHTDTENPLLSPR